MADKCYTHDVTFATKTEIDEHLAKVPHTYTGNAKCRLCGEFTDFEYFGKKAHDGFPAICDTCKSKIKSEGAGA